MGVMDQIYPGICRYVESHRYRDREDLINEGVVAALKAEIRYKNLPEEEKVKVVGRAAINAAVSYQRKQNQWLKRVCKLQDQPDRSIEQVRDLLLDLQTLLSKFDHEILIHLYHKGLDGEETSIKLGHSPATISRSRSRIKETIERICNAGREEEKGS